MIYFETPNNPMIKVTDVAAVKAVAGKDIRVVVDATFAPFPLTRQEKPARTKAAKRQKPLCFTIKHCWRTV